MTKYLTYVICIFFTILIYYKIDTYLDSKNVDVTSLTKKVEQLDGGLSRITSAPSLSDLEEQIKQLKSQNSKALASVTASHKQVDQLTEVITLLKGYISEKEGSYQAHIVSGVSTIDTASSITGYSDEYYDLIVTRKDSKGQEFPTDRVIFSPFVKADKWTLQNFPLELHTNVLQVKNTNGTYENTVETWLENNTVSTSKGTKYYLDNKISWSKREDITKSWLYNNRFAISLLHNSEPFPGVDFSFFSYGLNKRDMDYRFLVIGVGKSYNNTYMYIEPVQYNIGNIAPYVENLFLGLNYSITDKGTTSLGLSLSVPF